MTLSKPVGCASTNLPLGTEPLEQVALTTGLAEFDVTVRVAADLASTNTTAKQLLAEQAVAPPLLVTCESQSAGRGRYQRRWLSHAGSSLTFTVAVKLPRTDGAGLSLVVAVALANALAKVGCPVQLKWPNDLLAEAGGKLGGILLEVTGSQPVALIGVGINLVNFPGLHEQLPDAAWVFASAPPVERNQLLGQLCRQILAAVSTWQQEGFASFQTRWQQLSSHTHGEPVAVTTNAATREHLSYQGIGSAGQLLALDSTGQHREIHCGEITDAPRH